MTLLSTKVGADDGNRIRVFGLAWEVDGSRSFGSVAVTSDLFVLLCSDCGANEVVDGGAVSIIKSQLRCCDAGDHV